jgi:hypothetical protein
MRPYVRYNDDRRLRALERAARAGDPRAQEELIHEWLRTGQAAQIPIGWLVQNPQAVSSMPRGLLDGLLRNIVSQFWVTLHHRREWPIAEVYHISPSEAECWNEAASLAMANLQSARDAATPIALIEYRGGNYRRVVEIHNARRGDEEGIGVVTIAEWRGWT